MAHASGFDTVQLGDSCSRGHNVQYNAIKRVTAWDANDATLSGHGNCNTEFGDSGGCNSQVFGIQYGQDTLLEDVAAWGAGRKTSTKFNTGGTTTTRRAWARTEYSTIYSVHVGWSQCYGCDGPITEENVISTWNSAPTPDPYTMLDYCGAPIVHNQSVCNNGL